MKTALIAALVGILPMVPVAGHATMPDPAPAIAAQGKAAARSLVEAGAAAIPAGIEDLLAGTLVLPGPAVGAAIAGEACPPTRAPADGGNGGGLAC